MSLQSVNRTIKYFDKLKQNDVTGSTIILYCTTTQQEWHLLIAANKVCCFKHVLGTCKGRVKKNKIKYGFNNNNNKLYFHRDRVKIIELT